MKPTLAGLCDESMATSVDLPELLELQTLARLAGPHIEQRTLCDVTVDGRRLPVIEAVPNLDYAARTDDEKESRNYKFELWLDPEDAFPLRVDAEIVGEHSRLQKGTTLRQDFAKLPDGAWMPRILTIRYAAKLLKIHTVRGEATRTYSDFHKFSTDSTIQFAEK